MSLEKWDTLKSAFYSVLIFALAALALPHAEQPVAIIAAGIGGIIIVTTFEVREVEVANLLTMTMFRPLDDREDDD